MGFELFTEDFSKEHFENFSKENGFTFWLASDLMRFLDYDDSKTFDKAINKAVAVCQNLGIRIFENIIQIDNNGEVDYKLSRFGCYLVVMNASVKKKAVAQAQAYFARLAGAVQDMSNEAENIDRLVERGKISPHEKSLLAVAKSHGVSNYALFQSAGYRGLYNLSMQELKKLKNVPAERSLLDFMDSYELAVNSFRISQTELRIRNLNIKGQKNLENTAEVVGKMVRKTTQEISGFSPENLPRKEDIKTVKKVLKDKNKRIKAIDKPKKLPKKKP